MRLSSFIVFSASLASISLAQFQVPVPWLVTDLSISNVRHGTGGFWSFNIVDTPTPTPQGFNTTCSYEGNTYIFAIDDPPYDAPCVDKSVTFGLFPSATNGVQQFTFNVTHKYSCGKRYRKTCIDNGTWTFSYDDVRGQESDVRNNFGQSGNFNPVPFQMYPTRSVPSLKCEFC